MKVAKPKAQKAPSSDESPITRGMLIHMFENMKDFTRSLVKASETNLRKDLKTDIGRLEHAVTHHSKLIKDLDVKINGVRTELKGEMQSMRTELKEEIKGEVRGLRTELKEEIQSVKAELKEEIKGEVRGLRTELKEEIQSVKAELKEEIKGEVRGLRTELKGEIQAVRTELVEKMGSMESRLTEKIEGQRPILQNHEERITTLEGL